MTAFLSPEMGTPASRFLYDLSLVLKVPIRRLQPFIRFQEDLFLDRIDLQLLLAKLEAQHGRFLTEEEVRQIETIGDLQQLFLRQAA